MVVAAGSRESAPLEPFPRAPKASPPAGSPDRPSLHLRERNSSMKNRKRESCTSGTVRDEDGNILIYSARPRRTVPQTLAAGVRKPPGEETAMGERVTVPQALWGFECSARGFAVNATRLVA